MAFRSVQKQCANTVCNGKGDRRPWPQRVESNPVAVELCRHSKHAHRHAVLGHRVRDVRAEPPRLHVPANAKQQTEVVRAILLEGSQVWCMECGRLAAMRFVSERKAEKSTQSAPWERS